MHLPSHFEESRVEVLHALIRARPLATLVTRTPSGLEANHLPLLLLPEAGPSGSLIGHVARPNPIWKEAPSDAESLAIFQGASAYISPSWYPTKHEDGRAVPTWNYVVVHAHGTLRFHDDPAWVLHQAGLLTHQLEAHRDRPWTMADAPPDYLQALARGIVGVELVIHRLMGKWKAGQNQPPANRHGAAEGLAATGDPASADMARVMLDRLDGAGAGEGAGTV